MFGGLGNMLDLVKNAKDIKARMEAFQQELAHRRYDAETGGGAVKATVDGKGTLVSLRIDPSATSDVELLEDLVLSCVNAAVKRAHDSAKEELGKMAGGLNLPGLDSMLGS